MVKTIQPKTEKARDFVAVHGDKFIFTPQMEAGKIVVISAKTGKPLNLEMKNGDAYINGTKMEW